MTRSLRWLGVRLGLLLLLGSLLGCQTPSESARPAGETLVTPPPAQPGFLWEARRGAQIVTLVGTLHIGISADELPPQLWHRLEQADTVIIETDLNGMNSRLIRRFLLLPEQETLENLLGGDWNRFRSLMIEAFPQMPDTQLRRMTPMAACSNLMLAEARLAQQSDPRAEESGSKEPELISMDQFIFDQARSKGKKTRTLETLEEQFHYLEQICTLDQLRLMLADAAAGQDYFRDLEKAYLQGESATMDRLIAELPGGMRTILLDQRNRAWAQKLDGLLSPKHTLLAVGAAHFGGETSLLRLLAAQGFRIRTLPREREESQAPQPAGVR